MKHILFVFIFISCAKISYIAEQGVGQVALEYNDIDNEDFLKDPKQSAEHKRKVKIIMKAKEYFYNFFEKENSAIYDEVKVLDSQAVTYLVIHSPKNKIKALSTSFPFVGSFPYLGFFSKTSALEYKKIKEKDGYHTYMRNVYAYSTLNHPMLPMDDNILSSFFYYSDEDLVKLIFHELVHTIIFVKDNVRFNENLAEFISKKLLINYLSIDPNEPRRLKQKAASIEIRRFISRSSKELKKMYLRDSDFELVLAKFLKDVFVPNGKDICQKYKMRSCLFEELTWNNARFAAYGTYSEKQDELEKIYQEKKLTLNKFINKVIELNSKYSSSDGDFLTQLKKDL